MNKKIFNRFVVAVFSFLAFNLFFAPAAQAKITDNEKQLLNQAIFITQQAAIDLNTGENATAKQKLLAANGYIGSVISTTTDNKLLVSLQRISPGISVAINYIDNLQLSQALTYTLNASHDLDDALKTAIAGNQNTNTGGNSNTGGNNNSNTINANGNTPNTSTPNDQINTATSFTLGNLDESIGDFENILDVNSVPELIAVIIKILFFIIGLVTVIVIIVAGFNMVLAQGNETKVANAKKAITWAIVGLVVSLLAFSIVAIVQRIIQTRL